MAANSADNHMESVCNEPLLAKRMRKDPGATTRKNVVVLTRGNVGIRDGMVFMPNTIEMAILKKPDKGQFKTNIPFSSNMTETDVKCTLMETFPILRYKRFYCASVVDFRTRLEFHGERRIWDGRFIKKVIKGNSALYVFVEEDGDFGESEVVEDLGYESSIREQLGTKCSFDQITCGELTSSESPVKMSLSSIDGPAQPSPEKLPVVFATHDSLSENISSYSNLASGGIPFIVFPTAGGIPVAPAPTTGNNGLNTVPAQQSLDMPILPTSNNPGLQTALQASTLTPQLQNIVTSEASVLGSCDALTTVDTTEISQQLSLTGAEGDRTDVEGGQQETENFKSPDQEEPNVEKTYSSQVPEKESAESIAVAGDQESSGLSTLQISDLEPLLSEDSGFGTSGKSEENTSQDIHIAPVGAATRGDTYAKNVMLLKNEDLAQRDGKIPLPTTIEMARMRKTAQYKKGVQFSKSMSEDAVRKTIQEAFPAFDLSGRFYCASISNTDSTLQFHGDPRVWDGKTIRRILKGNSALYIVMEEIQNGLDMHIEIASAQEQKEGEKDSGFLSNWVPIEERMDVEMASETYPEQGLSESETSGISVSDPEFTQEDKFLQLMGDLDYEVDMEPKRSRLEGGCPFRVSFHPCLDANVTVYAVFVKSEDILGNVKLFVSPSCLFGHSIPGAPSSGWAKVIFKDQNDTHLGCTEIFYYPDGVEAVAMVQTPADQFKNFCEETSFHTASSFDSSDGDPQRYGAFGNAQQVQFLCLLIHTAAREGAQQFIEMIFSTSAGRLVFDAYKDSRPLPEVVARDHGHNETACYLEGVTKRFSVEISASREYPKKINWSELAQAAAGEAQTDCNAENESCHLISDLSKDAGYLGDLETSSSEPHSSGSEDDISIASKRGHTRPFSLFSSPFNQAECNTENESGDLTSDLSEDAGYLGDLETSKEPQSSDSEDDISIVSNKVNGDENLARAMNLEVIDVQSLQDTEVAEKFQEKAEVMFPKIREAVQCHPTGVDKIDDVKMEGKISDNSAKDSDWAQEEISTNSDDDMDQLRVVQDISPSSGSAKIFDISAEQPGVVQDIFPLSGSVKISDICAKDLDSIQEEICTNSDIDVDQRGVIENISPSLGSVKKGKEHADWDRISPQTIKLTTPGASSSGWGDVIFKAHHGYCLGSTKLFYYPDEREVVIMVKNPSLFETLCKDMSCHTANSSYNCSDEGTQRSESFGNAQQVQLLCLLVFTAAREGAQQFIEIIFSSSVGRLVFDAYKNSQPLPEVVAKDHGHNKTACYLEGVTKRFSEESFAAEEYPKAVDWSELAKAAEEAQRKHECNTKNESSDLTSNLLKDAGYLEDLETSSNEPQSSDSEDDIYITSNNECNSENEGSDLTSDLSKDAGYLGDLETSSNEPQSSDSEDGISITSNNVYGDENLARMMDFEAIDVHDVQSLQDTEDAEKFREKEEVLFPKMQEAIQCLPTMADKLDDVRMEGKISDISTKDLHLAREEISTNSDNDMDQLGVVQDISPSSSSVKKSQEHVDWDRIRPQAIKSTTSVEPSSEKTTQFDQAEDEEKTSFWSDCFKFREEFRKLKEELWKQTEEMLKQTVEALKRKVEPSSEETTQFDQAEDEEKTSFLSHCFKFRVPLEIYAQGPEAVKAYGKALTKGKACHKRISLMLIGQDQAGKTSLKKSLKGENFNEKEESTVGIETDSLYLKASTEIWKSGKVKEEVQFDPEDQFGHLATAELLRKISREDMENVAWLSPELDSVSDTKSESVLVPPGKSSAKSSRHGSTKPLRNTESLQRRLPEEVARLVEKMLQEEENANHEDNIYSVLWDFGGQSVYYETHPIFLKEKAIYILVSDLSRDPGERAILPVKTGLFEGKVDIDCNKTNLDYLDFWMSAIYSLVSPDVLSSQETTPNASHVLPRRLPPVFLVCTHADKPSDGSNARDLALEMYGTLLCKRYREHLYKDVFVVDNTKFGGEEECVEVRRLREEVLAVAKELQLTKEEIPLKWLRYENELRKKRDKWITLEEAKWVAFQDCEIQEDDEFSTLLNFLHDQGIVIHFSGSPELEKIVILDPQRLVDVLKNVITARRFKHTEHPVKDLWIQFEETGILDEKVIDHAWRDLLDNQESHKSLIAIMERLSLISPWPSSKDSKQYLVPSMLMLPPTDDVVQLLDSVHVPSLFETFASGRVPPSLFSRLILHFLPWCGGEWKSKVSPQLFHNFAMFHILPDQGISLIFCCHSIAIEVAVYSGDNDEKRTDIFRAVHWKLRFSLECMRKEFHWLNNMKYDMCVCCPVCSRPGSGKCRDHDVRGCECLHFLSESDLRQRQHCNRLGRSPLGDRRIWVKQFECWFLIGEGEEGAGMSTNQPLQAIHTTSHGGSLGAKGIFSIEGKKRKDLALPKNIKTSILSIPLNSESDVKDIVIQFQEALKLEPASLTSPEPETKSMIRYLALIAKSEKRDDLVRHLREITPAGTTGPLLNEDMSVDCMPHKQFKDLTFSLSGGDEWKLLAERLCFSQMEIRFLENRVVNPSEVVLSAVAKHRHLSVGEIYDTLVDCELPAIADLM